MLTPFENRWLRFAVFLLLALAALRDGGRVWAAAYYVLFGWIVWSFLANCEREIRTQKGQRALRKGLAGYFQIAQAGVDRQARAVMRFVSSHGPSHRNLSGDDLYQCGFSLLAIRLIIAIHIYVIAIAALDKFAPGLARSWYELTMPLVGLQLDHSIGFERMRDALVGAGYGDRLSYITHTYVSTIYLTIFGILCFAPKLPGMFQVEFRSHVYHLLSKYGARRVFATDLSFIGRVILPQVILIPAFFGFIFFIFVYGAVAVTVTPDPSMRFLLFAAHTNRAEMFPFAFCLPVMGVMILHIVKMVGVHALLSKRIIHRRIRRMTALRF